MFKMSQMCVLAKPYCANSWGEKGSITALSSQETNGRQNAFSYPESFINIETKMLCVYTGSSPNSKITSGFDRPCNQNSGGRHNIPCSTGVINIQIYFSHAMKHILKSSYIVVTHSILLNSPCGLAPICWIQNTLSSINWWHIGHLNIIIGCLNLDLYLDSIYKTTLC